MTNLDPDFIVTRDEFASGMDEMVRNIQDVMKAVNVVTHALNTQAEVLACHRYLLTRFIPAPILDAAVNDYVKERGVSLDAEIRRNLAELQREAHGKKGAPN